MKNKVIISTRPAESGADKLTTNLKELGAVYYEFPMIEIHENELSENEIKILKNSSEFDWIIFTSKNGVEYFFDALKKYDTHQNYKSVKFAVIGKSTAKYLQRFGYFTSYINTGNTSKRFASDLRNIIKKGEKVLFSLGNLANDYLPEQVAVFAEIDRINIYKTVLPNKIDENISKLVKENKYDLVLFTSPSGFENFIGLFPELQPEKLKAACIGDTTKQALIDKNFNPVITSASPDAEALTIAISEYFKNTTV